MKVSIEDINDLILLAQLLKNEEGKVDINGIADNMLDILYSLRLEQSNDDTDSIKPWTIDYDN